MALPLSGPGGQSGRGTPGQYVYWICMAHPTWETSVAKPAIGGGPALDATVKVSFASLAANLTCMVPCMGLHSNSRWKLSCVCAWSPFPSNCAHLWAPSQYLQHNHPPLWTLAQILPMKMTGDCSGDCCSLNWKSCFFIWMNNNHPNNHPSSSLVKNGQELTRAGDCVVNIGTWPTPACTKCCK